mmetsp:Transcript_87576/g.151641  ORF Transcript_87576/g.151641 Transcript_87576/m.151641 type:complete len:210 (+) Transcript_87576:67-696(+)
MSDLEVDFNDRACSPSNESDDDLRKLLPRDSPCVERHDPTLSTTKDSHIHHGSFSPEEVAKFPWRRPKQPTGSGNEFHGYRIKAYKGKGKGGWKGTSRHGNQGKGSEEKGGCKGPSRPRSVAAGKKAVLTPGPLGVSTEADDTNPNKGNLTIKETSAKRRLRREGKQRTSDGGSASSSGQRQCQFQVQERVSMNIRPGKKYRIVYEWID